MVGWTRQTKPSAIRGGYASTLGRSIRNSINAVNGSLAKRERTDQPRTTQGTLQEAWLSLISLPTIALATANAGQAGSLSYRKTIRRTAEFQLRSALEQKDVRLCRRLANNPITVSPITKKIAANWLGGNLHPFSCYNIALSVPYFGISRSALKTGRLFHWWSTIPHCAFSV